MSLPTIWDPIFGTSCTWESSPYVEGHHDDFQVHDRRVVRYMTLCTYRSQNDSYRNHRRVPTYGYDSQVHDINGSGFAAISPPDGVEIRVRGQNRGFLAWRVHFRGFQTSPTPTSGQKTRKTCIFERNWGPPLSRKVSKSKIIQYL